MKTSATKTTTPTLQRQSQPKSGPFFQKGGGNGFFSSKGSEGAFSSNGSDPFFSGSGVQTKLKVGQPNDKFEQQADQTADRVVQRLANPGAMPAIQPKCAECAQEEKVQKQEEREDIQNAPEGIQEKPIFESEGKQDAKEVQTKPTTGNANSSTLTDTSVTASAPQEENVQMKEEEQEKASPEEEIQRKPIFESEEEGDQPDVQAKCAECAPENEKKEPEVQTRLESGRVQAKLSIGQPNDKYEKEADMTADSVVSKISQSEPAAANNTSNVTTTNGSIQPNPEEKPEKEQKEEVTPADPELKKKPVAEDSDGLSGGDGEDNNNSKPNIQRFSKEMDRSEYPIMFKQAPGIQRSGGGKRDEKTTRKKIVKAAKKELGKIEARKNDGSGRRVGADRLLEIFDLAAKDIWADEVIEYVKYGTNHFPHWCGIFTVYATKKGGIDIGTWEMG